MTISPALKAKLSQLPTGPGVYFHKSKNGDVIYIGKASVLKNRVRQYFQNQKSFDIKTSALVEEITDVDWIETESEVDALFLESEMVKRYMPRYNILLRDDKSQTFVRIDMNNEWPYVSFSRNPADDKATYIGPFYNGYAVKKALRYLRKTFPYYTKHTLERKSDLDVHLGLSPRVDMASHEYKQNLKKLISYIRGNKTNIYREIERAMKRSAKNQEFEKAAEYRNKLTNLKELQRRIMFGDKEFLDISKDRALAQLAELLSLTKEPSRIEGYDISHTNGENVVASMVVFSNGVSDRASYRKFKIRSDKNDDVANIREVVERRFSDKNRRAWGDPDLLVIDGGKGQLSSAVDVLIRLGINIPVIGLAKRQEELVLPKNTALLSNDYIVFLQNNHRPGVAVLESEHHYIVNLHTGRFNAGGHSKNLRGGDGLSYFDDLMKLLQRIRDESHRFALSYHSQLRDKKVAKMQLTEVEGIGPVTAKKLLKHFGSQKSIDLASQAEVEKIVGPVLAQRIKSWQGNK